jgi:glucodextranase-like protein
VAPLITRMRTAPRRRYPVSRDRYRAIARDAGVPRPARPLWYNAALAGTLAVVALITLPIAISAASSGVGHVVASIQEAIPLLQGRGSIDIPAGGSSSIGAAPVADSLPAYTREPQLQLTGKVPSFAVQEGRSLQIILNGAVVATTPLDPSGAFNAALTLRDGPNSIGAALIADRDVVAASSYTVVLDRTPPTVTVERPTTGSTVDSQNIVVAGTTEQGSTITVNGRIIVITPEGAFTDSFSATPGSVPITVVARDRAGNETTQNLTVTAQQVTQATGLTVTVTVDKATVKPGQGVLVTVYVVGVAGPRTGVLVSGSVGVAGIGTAVTDGTGTARLSFAAPTTEGDVSVVVLAGGSSGRASLTISAR